MKKLFLYDANSTTDDTLTVMKRKGYICSELTSDPGFFWKQIEALEDDDVLVLLSHGDNNGPLAGAGTDGNDIDLNRFGKLVIKNGLKLYLLSCHTGENPCAEMLTELGVQYVAPLGNAVFMTKGDETVTVQSKDGDKFSGWAGSDGLKPNRATKELYLP